MAKMSIEKGNFDQIAKVLNEIGADKKDIAEKALIKSFEIVKAKAEVGMQKQNLPAGGKYDSGKTRKAIIQTPDIQWQGDTASVGVGFDIKKDKGFVSIWLAKGTPKIKPDKKLYDALYSKKTEKEIREAQEKVFYDEIARLKSQ